MIRTKKPLPWDLQDTRSEVQKMQHSLLQELGTLYRTQANLNAIMNSLPPSGANDQYRALLFARDAIHYLIQHNRDAMKNLPNKKRKAGLTKP